jgi:hypothetical protein
VVGKKKFVSDKKPASCDSELWHNFPRRTLINTGSLLASFKWLSTGHGGRGPRWAIPCVNNLSATCSGCSCLVGNANLSMTVMSAFDVHHRPQIGCNGYFAQNHKSSRDRFDTTPPGRQGPALLQVSTSPSLARYSRLSPCTTRCDHRVPGFIQIHNAPHLSNPVYTQHQRQLDIIQYSTLQVHPTIPLLLPVPPATQIEAVMTWSSSFGSAVPVTVGRSNTAMLSPQSLWCQQLVGSASWHLASTGCLAHKLPPLLTNRVWSWDVYRCQLFICYLVDTCPGASDPLHQKSKPTSMLYFSVTEPPMLRFQVPAKGGLQESEVHHHHSTCK